MENVSQEGTVDKERKVICRSLLVSRGGKHICVRDGSTCDKDHCTKDCVGQTLLISDPDDAKDMTDESILLLAWKAESRLQYCNLDEMRRMACVLRDYVRIRKGS